MSEELRRQLEIAEISSLAISSRMLFTPTRPTHHRRLGMRKLPANAAEDLLEIVMRRYERGVIRCVTYRMALAATLKGH
jgi:hypothetical protein